MNPLIPIIGDFPNFLEELLQEMDAEGFRFGDFAQLDHMCYRTISLENYEQKKAELSTLATLLGETLVNGRPITTFRLAMPVQYKGWRIDSIELPAPKAGSDFLEGLEHVEFVLFDDIPTFLKNYPNKTFEMRAADRGINPEVGYKLKKYAVKFHLLNLPTVVYLEHKLGIGEVSDQSPVSQN